MKNKDLGSRRSMFTLFAIITAGVLAGCSPAPQSAPTDAPTSLPSVAPATAIVPFNPTSTSTRLPAAPSQTPTNSLSKDKSPVNPTHTSTPPVPEPSQVTQAKQDLVKRLSINLSQIELVSFQPVNWPDSSLGCPQPGMAYSQIVTPGYRIQLRASGKVYEYHGGRAGAPFLCENPK